jgi:putative transcription antitermination factor YqgF
MLPPAEKVLAIDFGTVRIGLALSFGSLADPLTVIPNDQNMLPYICNIINNYKITRVIVGLSENEMARKTQEFVIQLKRLVKIPIDFHDETLSSHNVRSKLAAQRKTQNQPIDHLAAAEFLQDWLDTRPTKVPGL